MHGFYISCLLTVTEVIVDELNRDRVWTTQFEKSMGHAAEI
jgi:hypothetical protein